MERVGLSDRAADAALKKWGENVIVYKKGVPWWKKLLHQFADVMVLILIAAVLFSFFVGETVDALIILIVVLLNACIGFAQEMKAEAAAEALQSLLEDKARVIRGGVEQMILAREVVPGDVLVLREGDKVAADAVVGESDELHANDSVLTGESVSVLKQAKRSHVYMGTLISSGEGLAVVQSTGMNTEFGKVAHLTSLSVKDKSPLEKELESIGSLIGKVVIALAIVLAIVGVLRGETVIASVLFAVAVAVAAVPEGLPATITIALALGMQRLSDKKAIVKRLSSVETLGSTQVICTDKTGTLTKNQMTVVKAFVPGKEYAFKGVGYKPVGKVVGLDSALKSLMKGFVICQSASLRRVRRVWQVLGDPTEGALIVAARKCGLDEERIMSGLRKVRILPFDSARKMMTAIYGSSGAVAYTKGAPDVVLSSCTRVRVNGRVVAMTAALRRKYLEVVSDYSNQALRVLALATKSGERSVEKGMIFEGLVGMIDPARAEVKVAVEAANKAGISIVVITGDAPETAVAIARNVGIFTDGMHVVTGSDLEDMGAKDLRRVLKEGVLFARVSPADKLRVVEMCKRMKKVVAVTGDGVNDAPALKRADIGVAMGIAGTDVSREASDMVLADDSFATIVTAIYEGRRVYDNMKKFVFYLFSANVGELFTIFIALILGLPLPLTAILILLVNLGTDVLPALALGVDEPSGDLMNEAPRAVDERIMNKSFLQRILFIGVCLGGLVMCAFWWVLQATGSLALAQTVAFACLVLMQMTNVLSARSQILSVFSQRHSNWLVFAAIASSVLLLCVFMYVPLIATHIGMTPLVVDQWVLVLLVCLAFFGVVELRKFLYRFAK